MQLEDPDGMPCWAVVVKFLQQEFIVVDFARELSQNISL